ncbi:MAG: hypothetical protein IT372_26925 [Polyangiaceae bacterium]|nr:hypothetical protein [Polyangiaceae bacterium]
MKMNSTALLFSAALAACADGAQLGPDAHRGSAGGAAAGEGGGDAHAGGGDAHAGGGSAGNAGEGGAGGGGECSPGATRSCYTGPEGTRDVGACAAGTQVCAPDGSGYGPCEGEVLPGAESCAAEADDDCDGEVNEGCVCAPFATAPCYSGPAGTEGVGPCHAGVETCAADGMSWGPCEGEALPAPAEDVSTPDDDDCSGTTHDSICELHGILFCPSNTCVPHVVCGSQGGPLNCTTVWQCATP